MKNINVCFLAAVACTYSIQVSANSLNNNLNFTLENNVYSLHSSSAASHTVTPLELKPILNSNSGVKLAAVCALGGGGCSGLGFNSGDNNINLDNASLCKEQGYMLNGSCADGANKNEICPYNEAFFKSCTCDTTQFTQSGAYTGQCGALADVNTCSASDGSKYYRCDCDTSMVTKCDATNQYAVAGTEICRDSKGGDYIANNGCKSCNAPAIVNTARNNCTCPSTYVTCGTNQNGLGTNCTADGGNKYSACECPNTWVACDAANNETGAGLSCTINGVTKFESCGCPASYKTCNSANNEVEIGKSCTIGGVSKFENCSCPSNFVTCNKGGEVGAKKCSLNGTDYWSQCKPELTNEQICIQKLATHSSASGYAIYESGKSKSMGKGYIIVGTQTASTLPGTKIYGASYFSQIPECVSSMAKLSLRPTLSVVTSTISTVTSLQMENVEIELDPINNTGQTYLYVTGILIDPGTGSSMNNSLKNVIFSSKMKDFGYYYLRLGNPITKCPSSGPCVKTGANNTALYIYDKVEMKGIGYSMLQPASGPVYITSGSTLELDGAQFSGGNGGQIRINSATMKIRYLAIGAENTKLSNGSTESIVIMENNSKLYASDELMIDSQGTTRLEIASGSKVYTPQVGLRLGPEILIRGTNSGLYILNTTSDTYTPVITTSNSSSQCLMKYNGGGSSVDYGYSKINTLASLFKCN